MRSSLLAVLLLGTALMAWGETVQEWVNGAPQSGIVFIPWDGDLPTIRNNGGVARQLSQGLYGYLDLSHLPAEAFPVTLHLIYDGINTEDIIQGPPGTISQLIPTASVGQGAVVEQDVFASPLAASKVPVWRAPIHAQAAASAYLQESVRAEITSRTGAILARKLIGASTTPWGHPRGVVINTPTANQPFTRVGYNVLAEVKKLVPDSYAYQDVDTIWIDSATATDKTLSDAFWSQILLGGTTVAGRPEDMAPLFRRLGLVADQPILKGRLVAAGSPEAFTAAEGQVRDISNTLFNGHVASNPFGFTGTLGRAMHRELLHYSEYYMGIFVVLQIVVIILAFLFLKGTKRVWLWLIVPAFALAYTFLGVGLSHVMVRARSAGHLGEVELQREGWPQAVLLTHFEDLNLADREIILDLPPDSRPFAPSRPDYLPSGLKATFVFGDGIAPARLNLHPRPATRAVAGVRSIINADPPFQLTKDGKLYALRSFSGAWLWDGGNWHDLGGFVADPSREIDWRSASIIHPTMTSLGRLGCCVSDDQFPSALESLFDHTILNHLWFAREGLFLGAETRRGSDPQGNAKDAMDVQVEGDEHDYIETRHIVAYQFHLPKETP